jgi:hypothetical protein
VKSAAAYSVASALAAAAVILAAGASTPYPAAAVAAAVVHGAGHLAAARLCGLSPVKMNAVSPGAVLTFDFTGRSYGAELAVKLAGPAANLAAAVLSLPFRGDGAMFFRAACVVLAAVNLLPAGMLDGGGALRCFIAARFDENKAAGICAAASVVSAFILWAASAYVQLRLGGDVCALLLSIYLLYRALGEKDG